MSITTSRIVAAIRSISLLQDKPTYPLRPGPSLEFVFICLGAFVLPDVLPPAGLRIKFLNSKSTNL